MIKKKSNQKPSVLRTIRNQLPSTKSQEDVAREAGISLRAYQEIENGEAIPNLARAVAICRVLNISLKTFCAAKEIDISGLPDDCSVDQN